MNINSEVKRRVNGNFEVFRLGDYVLLIKVIIGEWERERELASVYVCVRKIGR